MATFHFRLATLLRLREAERDERRAQLSDAQQAEAIVAARVSEIDREIGFIRQLGQLATAPGKVDVDQLLDMQRYDAQLKLERIAAEDQRGKIAQEVERRLERAIAADREVRILEKLRETQLAKHRSEEEKVEQKRFDEMAGQLAYYREES
jgi:flagellar FliJ protein